MPTYDYQCLDCGDNFELFQSMSEKAVKTCPKCKGKVKRLIGSGAGLIFKGSGFYATDYKKQSAASDANRQKPSSPACSGCKDAPKCPQGKVSKPR